MADQTYNLTQTGAEVQAIINDASGVKGAGATTSLTTDYIMLKDTSGNYHKIQKSSFTEAVRNTLASLLVNNDKGTTINQIPAIASGDFGSVTPANLASVLGVGSMSRYPVSGAIEDLNSMEPNRWTVTSSTTTQNLPAESPTSDQAYFCFGYSNSKLQIGGRNGNYFVRVYHNSSWGAWVKI